MTPAPDRKPRPAVLGYARPQRPITARRLLGGVLGVAAGLLSLPIILFGIMWCIHVVGDAYYPADRRDDIVKAVTITSLGVVLIFVSLRWCGFAFSEERDA